jgi:toxin-antitoxin system, antitoxin component, xre family
MQNNLKQIRNNKNLLQTKVAMDLNITQETISSYETGRVFPSSDMLIKLADYYNTSIDYILCRTKYDMPIDSIKPNNITDEDFILLNKIHKLSFVDKAKAEAYIDGLND